MSTEEAGETVQVNSPFAFVQLTPFSYYVQRVDLGDGRMGVQFTLLHATGATTVVCMPEEARSMANEIAAKSGGLITKLST